ncbi:hypothetical protein WJX77_008466 [Trebouxia sp. C0004]
MYNGLRNGTSSTLQRLLQELGFNSYKQLQEPNSSRHIHISETKHHDSSESELSYSSAPHSVATRARPSAPFENGPLETLQAMLLDLEAHKEVKTKKDSDKCSQGEVSQAATVLQADLLGLNSPTYKASTSKVSPSIQPVATEPKRHRSPSDMAVAALSDVLETNDKQHLSITILLNDNQQLQDKLDATMAELSNVRSEKHTAMDACATAELLLAESQEAAKQARIAQSRMQARADAAFQAAAAAEAKLAGQAMTGRGYIERMALLKSQLQASQKRLESQGTDVRVMRSQATQTDLCVPHQLVCESHTQQELEQQSLAAAVNKSMHREGIAQQLTQQLQAACTHAQDISSQLATLQKAQRGLQAEFLELTQRESDTAAKHASNQAELDAAQAHVIALQDQLASSDQHSRQSKHDLASAQAGIQQGSQHAINIQALEQQLLAVQQEHAKAAEQLNAMTEQHQESKLQGQRVQRLAAETAQVSTAQQQTHHAQFSAIQDKHDGLQCQFVQAQARVQSTSQHNAQLQHDVQAQLALAAQQAFKVRAEHEQALAGVQIQLATAQAEAAQQATRADKLQASWATMHEQLAMTAARLAEYATCQNQGQETIEGLLLQVQQLQKECAATQSKHEQELAASVQSGKEQADAAAQKQALLVLHSEARMAQHQEELSHVQAESATQLAALQILYDHLEGKLSAKQSALADLQEQHAQAMLELRQQLSAAEFAIAAAQSQAATSAEKVAEQTSKVDLLTEKLIFALARSVNLQEKLDAAATRQTDSTLDSKATETQLQAEITAAQVTIKDRERLATQHKTELATVSTQLQTAEAEACVSQKMAQQALVDTEVQHADHVAKLEARLRWAQSDREQQQDQLQLCVQDLSKALAQQGLLSHALNAANQHISTRDTVKQQQQELTEQTVQHQATAAQLRAAQDRAESAVDQVASAQAKMTAAQAEAKAESEAAAYQLSTVQYQLDVRQQQLAAVQAEQATAEEQHQQAVSRLAAQLGTADDKAAKLSLAVAALESRMTVAKLQAEADSQTAAQKLVGVTTGMDAASETVADLRKQLHMVTSEAAQLQKQLKEQLQTSEEVSVQLQANLQAIQQAAAHRQAQHDRQLAALQKASCQLHDQLQSAQQANTAVQSQSAAAQQANLRCQAQLQSELAASQQAITHTEAELQASQQSHSELLSQSEEAQQASYHTQHQLQIDLKLSQEAVAQLSAQLQGSQLTVENLQHQMHELKESPLHTQLAERHFKQQLAALPQPEGQAEGHPGLHHSLSGGPGFGLNALLSSEVGRLQEEVGSLRRRVQGYEVDVDQLVATTELGHANPKQKIQYHLRWKQELETIRKECTVLLRERYMLEQCVRYLAVRLGLNVAVVKDVFGQHERTALDRVQPASLTQHYKFAPHSRHLSDARLEDADLDLEVTQNRGSGDVGKADALLTASPAGQASPHSAVGLDSNPGSIGRGNATETCAAGVEAHILARIAAVCQPGMYQKAKQAQGSTSRSDKSAAAMKGPASPEPNDKTCFKPVLSEPCCE